MTLVGLDEVGRGCWAGPVVAAAVVLDPLQPIAGLADSKKLSAQQRHALAASIRLRAAAIGVGWVWPGDIDEHGLTWAVGQAMRLAIEQIAPDRFTDILIDGNYNFLPDYAGVQTMVRADGLVAEVSAASIIAKVSRDHYMATVAAAMFPAYGFEAHVGYGTARHIAALRQHGVTELHRRSYKPIKVYLA